jgi:hypothetical protein
MSDLWCSVSEAVAVAAISFVLWLAVFGLFL